VNNYGTVFEVQNIGTVAAPIYASAPTTLVSFNAPPRVISLCGADRRR
jgi:hypothetical protein